MRRRPIRFRSPNYHHPSMENSKVHTVLVRLYLVVALVFGSLSLRAQAENHPFWEPTGNPSELKPRVEKYLSMSDSKLRNQINRLGRAESRNLGMVEKTYEMALLYHFTKKDDYARRAILLLNRYADVFPDWVKRFEERLASGEIPSKHEKGAGIWSTWFHKDMKTSINLALAYELVRGSDQFNKIGSGVRNKIKNFLREVVKQDLGFRLVVHNQVFNRPLGLFVYGRVLDDPVLVHLGFWFYNKVLHEAYCFDGFYMQGSYSYNKDLTNALTLHDYPLYMNGYSDPPGFVHTPL